MSRRGGTVAMKRILHQLSSSPSLANLRHLTPKSVPLLFFWRGGFMALYADENEITDANGALRCRSDQQTQLARVEPDFLRPYLR